MLLKHILRLLDMFNNHLSSDFNLCSSLQCFRSFESYHLKLLLNQGSQKLPKLSFGVALSLEQLWNG